MWKRNDISVRKRKKNWNSKVRIIAPCLDSFIKLESTLPKPSPIGWAVGRAPLGASNVLRFSHLPGSPSQAPFVFGFSCEMFVCWRGSFTRTNKVTKSHAQSGLWIQERTAYKYVYHNRDIQHSEQIIIRPNKRKIDQSFLDSLSSKSHAQSGLWIQERTAYKYVKKWNKWRPKGPNKTKNKMQWPYML